jgi:hypothetical protein
MGILFFLCYGLIFNEGDYEMTLYSGIESIEYFREIYSEAEKECYS